MPSPFPGMDPFLESSELFPDLHDRFVGGVSDALNSQLRAPYFSAIASRVTIEFAQRRIGPDVSVVHSGDTDSTDGGGTAVLPAVDVQPVIIHVPQDEIRELWVEIRTAKDERLVTSIEVLSLSNKTPGKHDRDLYVLKQDELLARDVHLVEIDLLRGGHHSTAVPLDWALRKTGRFDYHVCVHRFNKFEDFAVYPILLQSRLPKIGVPLLPGDADVTIDLQAIFDRCYDVALYARRIRYGEALSPPLSEQNEKWVRELLAAKMV